MDKLQTLTKTITHHETKVTQYQINIDNFTAALGIIDSDYTGEDAVSRHMRETFRPELEQRIIDEKIQQARSDVIRKACAQEIATLAKQEKQG